MKNEKRFSFQIKNPENIQIKELILSDEDKKLLGFNKKEKTHFDYLIEYLGEKEFTEIFTKFDRLVHRSITEEQKKLCSVCGENPANKEANKLCDIFVREAGINFLLAGWEFITIINNNKNIFIDKEQIKRLTRSFFTCFCFYEGHVYFELKELAFKCLEEGLLRISVILSESSVFDRFNIINTSLTTLKNEYRYYKLKYNSKNKFLKSHIKWYEDQERFYIRNEEIKEKYGKTSVDDSDIKNPYPHIFRNKQSFNFFENLLQDFEIKTSRSQVSDLTDIYILMQKDDLIFESFKPTPFVNWLNEKYDFLSIDRLETVSTRRTPKRKYAIYNKAKQLFYKTSA